MIRKKVIRKCHLYVNFNNLSTFSLWPLYNLFFFFCKCSMNIRKQSLFFDCQILNAFFNTFVLIIDVSEDITCEDGVWRSRQRTGATETILVSSKCLTLKEKCWSGILLE